MGRFASIVVQFAKVPEGGTVFNLDIRFRNSCKRRKGNLATIWFSKVPVLLGNGKVQVASNFFEPINKLKSYLMATTKL